MGQLERASDCITAVTATICRLFDIEGPALADGGVVAGVIEAAASKGIMPIEKCLVYAPDAIGTHFYHRHAGMFATVLEHAPVQVLLRSVFPPKTPVCFASMFTGAPPEGHGIRMYEKPVLACDTLFDAMVRAGKRVAIVAVADSSIDLIFRNRSVDYYSEVYDQQVTARAINLIEAGEHDLIVAYHQEYDDCLHRSTPESEEAMAAAKRHADSFSQLAACVDSAWRKYNRLVCFTPDHGGHVDPETGKGTHCSDIPEDMEVYHFYGIENGRSDGNQ